MAAQKKKPTPRRRVQTVDTNEYNKLEMYCIWLHEYYSTLVRTGFKHDIALALIIEKDSYPDWVEWKIPTDADISKYMDEDED